mmetsp:Transcript_19825/g.27885  ORF Transcript_19825/g.27885 Transcript_19825/m.27885 type:complete len:156 (-) Transcript_19825:300-767(-)|eukprot:CAMPEP_0184865592 /NCGR_PEP_ID=MMETSP0580-20130426/18578_1 /TAXON_ID=1118495 /ORGANISM="Dactyliosolen fragilissimus" /LENGTH=155 /DNA_ID=CAMNT_0027364865 /DNA_START=21 /DNA_END=488 /DNA_ORIENTATION=-
MSGKTEAKLEELGIKIPPPLTPKGNYAQAVKSGNLLHLCGHIPLGYDGVLMKGKVGKDITAERGYESARMCAINIISTLKTELKSLDKVKKIVKIVGFVNCTDDFEGQPAVINGASDLFVKVFEERGVHARSAVGSNALPLGISTEVECVVEIEE